jgi:hypothetical protein
VSDAIWQFVLELVPEKSHPEFGNVEGAFAVCYVSSKTAALALERASAFLKLDLWNILSVDVTPRRLTRSDLSDAEVCAKFDQASIDGEVYVLHSWSFADASERPRH